PDIVLGCLELPADLAGVHVESDQRIAGVGRGERKICSGPSVDNVASRIDKRRGPDRGARWPPQLCACAIPFTRCRLLHRVPDPELTAGRQVKSDESAPALTALVAIVPSE